MVTCKVDSVPVSKMNSVRSTKPSGSSSSGFRLLDSDHLETSSTVSRNSVYKLKIDLMFDESRSIRSHQMDDPRGSRRTRSIIMYGRSELASTTGESSRSVTSFLREANEVRCNKLTSPDTKKDVQRVSNTVQAQIEQLFTDVAKDATSTFAVTCLGSIPLKDKVTSLQGLQAPLRELYFNNALKQNHASGCLDICSTGLRVKIHSTSNVNDNDNLQNNENTIPFHNIAVWSAVKFMMSEEDGGAAFLPLITDPENIDKTALFQPLSSSEEKYLASNAHAPLFAVVMRSAYQPKMLECHAFICQSSEDAIRIAATLYQSLMAHVSTNSNRSTKRRTPHNKNGVSCISIASSSAVTGSHYLSNSQTVSNCHKNSFRSSSVGIAASRSIRKKRNSASLQSDVVQPCTRSQDSTTEERKRRSHKTKRAPSVPITTPGQFHCSIAHKDLKNRTNNCHINLDGKPTVNSTCLMSSQKGHYNANKALESINTRSSDKEKNTKTTTQNGHLRIESNGDILTRVAIPRSGSFLNTGGLTRYKSRAARRSSGKLGGGGGSPLGFSELFNEFRLHENLNSLDEILSAIINADGMSFNDLKPIYKEFLLKLAVTLTGDELFQRSKNIMRRQKKKKSKKKQCSTGSQKKQKTLIFGGKSFKKVFQLGQFQSCRGKTIKSTQKKTTNNNNKTIDITGPMPIGTVNPQRSRIATSGSDISVIRHENAFVGLNRNSSSGYVSCSECSYDSETCTCTSADRCYCSLRTDHANHKIRCKTNDKKDITSSKISSKNKKDKNKNYFISGSGYSSNRQSLVSCKSNEKCYCSMVEKKKHLPDEESPISDTTYCDTDSCISTSKCYCKRNQLSINNNIGAERIKELAQRQTHGNKPKDKFALDYELFSIGANGKSVQPHEALSMKKSVEAAAIFADVKLSQTTDIKSLYRSAGIGPNLLTKNLLINDSCRSVYSTKKQERSYKKRESISIDRRNEQNAMTISSQKSSSSENLLTKLSAIERTIEYATADKCNSNKNVLKENYKSMRAVSGSLEDTLGYLP